MPPDTGRALELAADEETTREVSLHRRPSFILPPTQQENLEGGTVKVSRQRLRSRDPLLLTGPPEPVFSPADSSAARPHISPAQPDEDEGEPTRVQAFARSSPPPRRLRSVANEANRRDLTGPPPPMELVVRPPTPAPARGRPSPQLPRELPYQAAAPARALDSISRICWNVMATPDEPTRPRRFHQRWRQHRRPLALGAGALGALAMIMLVQVSWGGSGAGSIKVVSSPPGAQVRINGQALLQTTPAIIDVPDMDRPQRVELSLAHHRSWTQAVTLSAASPRVTLVAVLEPEVDGDHGPVVVESLSP